jgi:Fic family protein
MDRYDELIKSLENYLNATDDNGHLMFKQTAEAIGALKSAIDEKQTLLDEALEDLAKENDCKNCAHVGQCSAHRIERNFAYGGCSQWQWRGAKLIYKAS